MLQKNILKLFLRDTILRERQEIVSTNSRVQKEGKEIMLGIYNDIVVKLFAPLLKTVNKQPDEQLESTDMLKLVSE